MPGPFKFSEPHELSRNPVVYAIGWSRKGPIKIGYTTNDPEKRLSDMLGSHPDPKDLRVLATWPGDRELELQLHRHFAERRLRRGAEWFEVTLPEIANAIETLDGQDH